MQPQLQRRVQRYGWDLAVATYEQSWRDQLGPAHDLMLDPAWPQAADSIERAVAKWTA